MTILKVNNLKTYFKVKTGFLKAVDDISFEIEKSETLALVGESGCGKSVTALSILRLIPEPGEIVAGNIVFNEKDISNIPEKEMNQIRGKQIGYVMQDPLASLNPVMKVGEQISEVLMCHFKVSKKEAKRRALKMMEKVRLPSVEKTYKNYPHELSGGLRQRVCLAIALICSPSLLIADEPTTALDVTIQQQILDLLKDLKKLLHLSILLISHDLGIVANSSDHVAVMYAGKIVEHAPTDLFFEKPLHPYSRMLASAIPNVVGSKKIINHKKNSEFTVPDLSKLPPGCAFAPRCLYADTECTITIPEMVEHQKNRYVKCRKIGEIDEK